MAAHSFLKLGGVLLFGAREGYVLSLASLFRDQELMQEPSQHPYEEVFERYEYAVTAAEMRERLDALGYTVDKATGAIAALGEPSGEHGMPSFEIWASCVISHATGASPDDAWDENLSEPEWTWSVDPPLLLRLLLEKCPAGVAVALDLAEVVNRGHVDTDPQFCAEAFATVHGQEPQFGPLVVLTEGHSDADVLATALDILRPHLVGFVRFLDYSHGPEGGAAALVRAVKAFAAAGINNRVVAVFDNDTAAAEALLGLDSSRLPPNFRVLRLPPLQLGSEYPTLGDTGAALANINGTAGSIEMYFGSDILAAEGQLAPVRWVAYVEKIGRYQGVLENKKALHAAFRLRAKEAKSHGGPRPHEDWTGMAAALDAIIGPD